MADLGESYELSIRFGWELSETLGPQLITGFSRGLATTIDHESLILDASSRTLI